MAGALGSISAARGRKYVGERVWLLYHDGVPTVWSPILRLSIDLPLEGDDEGRKCAAMLESLDLADVMVDGESWSGGGDSGAGSRCL